MRKLVVVFVAAVVLGAGVALSLTSASSAEQNISPKCAKNCSPSEQPEKASGIFIIDSYSGSL